MGTSRKIKTETRKRTDKATKTNDRRAGKADGYIGGLEYTLEQQRKMIIEDGINPETGQLYSIAEHSRLLDELGATDEEHRQARRKVWPTLSKATRERQELAAGAAA